MMHAGDGGAFSLIKTWGHENKGNDHPLKKFLIVTQILLVSTLGNV